MAIGPISRTRHDVPDVDRTWRPGPPSHEESGVDLADYAQPLERAHLLALHGPGIAQGLALSAEVGGSRITVEPGVAVDAAGRHIVLAPDTPIEVSDKPETTSLLLSMTAGGLELSTVGRKGRCLVHVLWRETFDKALLQASTQNPPQRFVQRHTPWIRVVPAVDPQPPDGVVLGTVVLDDAGTVVGGPSAEGRAAPEAAGRGYRVRGSRVVTQAGRSVVDEVDAGRLGTGPDGGVRLESDRAALSVRPRGVAVEVAGNTASHLSVDAATGRVGVGTDDPSHPLHVPAARGLRQGELYLTGGIMGPGGVGPGTGWCSISYNAHHNDANNGWVFPSPSRPAVTVEMDDNSGRPRFEVWSSTPAAPMTFQKRLDIDGTTGAVAAPTGPIVPRVGDATTAGIQFPLDPGGGAGDSAYIRYSVEGGEQTALIIGCENDANDRIVLRQSNKETLVLAAGRVGVSTRDPAFDLQVNGTACANQFCNPSDARLKSDITALSGVLDRLAGVRGVSFTDRPEAAGEGAADETRRRLGVVAQDVEPAFPELVVPMEGADRMAVDYSGLVGVLVAAVNELSERTERLTRELASLRAAPEGTRA